MHLSTAPGPLAVAEGVETALSLASGICSSLGSVWAALSSSGMAGLRLPEIPHEIVIATDGDSAGRRAGNSLAERAHSLGWRVSLLSAPYGKDWNDVLLAWEEG
ncbi:toprim domain-containing protein [Phaeobacter italicus]|uniref:toprim domain-containing protein n=1 Tax=Phaeobacter italicus TaxID=481446 RepID=UPI001CD7162F|nr:toprim domain-containing protein [Phaeobacter italicus]MCA0857280.1 toprim domain-containing protein [Phaeobacter italicus]